MMTTMMTLMVKTDGYIPQASLSSAKSNKHRHQTLQPLTVRTPFSVSPSPSLSSPSLLFAFSVDDAAPDEEERQEEHQAPSSEIDKPQPPDTPPPVAYFAVSKEVADREEAELEAAKKAKADADAKAAAEAEAAKQKAEKEARWKEEAKRQAEIAAQMLFEAERKAQQEAEERRAREEENRRRQEEFIEWTNQFIQQYIVSCCSLCLAGIKSVFIGPNST